MLAHKEQNHAEDDWESQKLVSLEAPDDEGEWCWIKRNRNHQVEKARGP